MDHDYDLIVIGGGAAGLAAAQAGAAAKARTLLVAEGEPGGECTFTGCVPSKTLIGAAARGAGFTEAMAAVRKTVAAVAAAETADVLTRRGIDVLRGHAEFTTPRQVAVDGRTLRARGIVLAAGSRPAVPPVPGLAGTPYLTNENIFELDRLPGSLAIVGGGAVGCELAQALRRLGAQVTLIEAGPRLLPAADPQASKILGKVFAAEGITVRAGSAVEKAEFSPNGPGFLLRLNDSSEVAATHLLVAAGRVPVTRGLGLEVRVRAGPPGRTERVLPGDRPAGGGPGRAGPVDGRRQRRGAGRMRAHRARPGRGSRAVTGTGLMTVGELSRRTGTPARALRAWTDMGLVYSAGRSPAGYRLYDESALWCVTVIGELRGLGLTIAEIRALADVYLGQPGEPVGPHLAALLRRARDRADTRIADLQELRERIDHALASDDLAGDALRGTGPRHGAVLDLAPGGKP